MDSCRPTLPRLLLACALALALPGTAWPSPTLSGPATVGEGAGKATYTLNCDGTLGTWELSVEAGPAPSAQPADYGAPAGPTGLPSLLCTGGEVTFDVPIVDDTEPEHDEWFRVKAAEFLGENLTFDTRIIDNDVIVEIVPFAQVLEGDSGTKNLELAVTLSQAHIRDVTVPYTTADLSAKAGEDYVAKSGNLLIPAGQTAGTISVAIIGDRVHERPEGFLVNLGTPTGALLNEQRRQAIVAIFDNDPAPLPELSFAGNVRVKEGDSGVVNALFRVNLSHAAAHPVDVSWRTGDGTADSTDYRPGKGTLRFAPGERAKTISINVRGDRRPEPDEHFGVLLEKPAGATIKGALAWGIIVDDDRAGPKMRFGKARVTDRAILARVRCPETASACTGKLKARARKLKVGKAAKFDLAPGDAKRLKIKLSPRAREARRDRRVRTRLVAVARDAEGERGKSTRKLVLPRTSG